MSKKPKPLTVVYVLRKFPVLSETFILNEILEWTADDYREQLRGSAMKRATLEMLKRNARIAAANQATGDTQQVRIHTFKQINNDQTSLTTQQGFNPLESYRFAINNTIRQYQCIILLSPDYREYGFAPGGISSNR